MKTNKYRFVSKLVLKNFSFKICYLNITRIRCTRNERTTKRKKVIMHIINFLANNVFIIYVFI